MSSLGGALDFALLANLDTTRVTDEGSTRTVMIVSGALVVVALVLIGVTVWFWRNTVPDPDALEALAFFEERVVDGSDDDGAMARRRPSQPEGDVDHRAGLHLPRRHRTDRVSKSDRTQSSERTAGERRRRHPRD